MNAVFLLLFAAPAPGMTHAEAEQLAHQWWAGDWPIGAAWKDEKGTCCVGVSHGKVKHRRSVHESTEDANSWIRVHNYFYKAPDGWYSYGAEFGRGKTWEEAFKDAIEHHKGPCKDGMPDEEAQKLFLWRLRR